MIPFQLVSLTASSRQESSIALCFVCVIQLPKFVFLCEDGVWGVRKACIECFVHVASVCSPEARRDELIPLYLGLINDQSRWVCTRRYKQTCCFTNAVKLPVVKLITGLASM
jgi:hypothetical protein